MKVSNLTKVTCASAENRRAEQRFPLRLPIQFKCLAEQIIETASVTRNISAHGAYFFLDFEVREGSPIEMTLELPPEFTASGEVRVRCKGRIVGVRQSPLIGKSGVAVVIERYEFLQSD
jgi:hypothetical protein